MVLSTETIEKLSEHVASYSVGEKIDFIQGHRPVISKEGLDELTSLIDEEIYCATILGLDKVVINHRELTRFGMNLSNLDDRRVFESTWLNSKLKIVYESIKRRYQQAGWNASIEVSDKSMRNDERLHLLFTVGNGD